MVTPQWDGVSRVAANCLKVDIGEMQGLVDCSGNELSPCVWYGFSSEANGLMVGAVQKTDEANSTKYTTAYQYDYYLVDTKGNTLTPAYKTIGENEPSGESWLSLAAPEWNSGLIRVQGSDNKWGFIDAAGTVKIALSYSAANAFSNDLAAVKDGYWGYIDASGEFVIAPQFSAALDFNENDRAEVRCYSSWHVIDKSGAIIYFEGQSFDEMPEPGEFDNEAIIKALADWWGVEPQDEFMVWYIFDMAEMAGVIDSKAVYEGMDTDDIMAAINDMDAFLEYLENYGIVIE